MANDVKSRSSYYPTKLTPSVSPPSHRDYQRNNNQTIPTTTTQDQAIDVPPGISDTFDDNDEHKITLEDIFFDTYDDDDVHFTPSISDIFPAIETTARKIFFEFPSEWSSREIRRAP